MTNMTQQKQDAGNTNENFSSSNNFEYQFLQGKKFYVTHTIVGSDAATAGNYGVFFINQIGACYISGFWEVHQTAGNDGGAVTLDLEKLTGTQALDAGTSTLSAALSLKATANTVQTATMTATNSNRNLAIGDRLALKDTGALTNVNNVTIIIEITI